MLCTRQVTQLAFTSVNRALYVIPRATNAHVVRRMQSTAAHPTGAINPQDEIEVEEEQETKNTGIIKQQKQETLFYFDHLFPYSSQRYNLLRKAISSAFFPTSEASVKKRITELVNTKHTQSEAVMTDSAGQAFTDRYKFKSVQVMKRDGGAFVKFSVPVSESVKEVNEKTSQRINAKSAAHWYEIFWATRCFPVKGVPWIEDLKRYPSQKVKVSFDGPDLSQEEMYALFRRYGVIKDIIPPAADAKERSATIIYKLTRGAITAKNCLNGYIHNNTKVHIDYIPEKTENQIINFIMNHQRISIPLMLTLLTAVAFFIFEPIREWFIKEKISHRYSLRNILPLKMLMDWTSSTTVKVKELMYLQARCEKDDQRETRTLWTEREEKIKEIKLWLEENVNTFVVVRGPKGSGKHDIVVDHALKDRSNVLVIDCDSLIAPRSEQKMIASLAQQVGYFPSFLWLNSVSSIMDLGLQGLIGQKSGISESKEQQVKSMLNTALAAIRDLSLEQFHELQSIANKSKKPEDEQVMKEEDFLQQHPEAKPVIVIDRYQPSRKANEKNSFVYKEIADWAANLVTANLAHVIFISDDIGSQTQLSDSLPNQVFKTSTLSDASADSAKNYVLGQLQGLTASTMLLDRLDEIIKPLGGRMLDLQAFVRRIKSGESPKEAIDEMITQTAEQLTQVFFNKSNTKYTSSQVWTVMKKLAAEEEIEFKDLVLHPLFKASPVEILSALESTELVFLVKDRGLVKSIQPGKPLYKASFENLVNDEKIYKDLEIKYNQEIIALENKNIAKYLDEINKFGVFSDLSSNKMFKPRLDFLANKMKASTETIVQAEAKVKELGSK